MKIKLMLIAMLLLAAFISNGQNRIKYKDLDTEKISKKEFRTAKKEYKAELKKGFDFTLSPEQRLKYDEAPVVRNYSTDAQTVSSWGVDVLMPSNIRQRVVEECDNYKVNYITVDSGIDPNHIEYTGNWWLNPSNYTGDPNKHWHGTHVTGIVWQMVGELATKKSNIKFKDAQILNKNGSGSFTWAANMAATETSNFSDEIDNGELVVFNNSWGCTCGEQNVFEKEVKKSVEKGMIWIASAGNSGGKTNSYPASSEYTTAVAALDQSLKKAGFSTVGPFVKLGAPGTGINSTLPNNSQGKASGTSMAAPFISGLAIQAGGKYGPILNGLAMDKYLTAICTDIPPDGFDENTGWGVPYVLKMLNTNPCDVIDCDNQPEDPTCNDKIKNGDEEGVDCGGSKCPPCENEPEEPVFKLRTVPVVINGEWKVYWRDFGSQATGYNASYALDQLDGINEFGETFNASILPSNNFRSGYVYVTEVVVRVMSTKPSEVIVEDVHKAINEQWQRRGILTSSPGDAAIVTQHISYFMDLFATRDYGLDVTIAQITAHDGNNGIFTYNANELRQYPIGSDPFFVNPSSYDINLDTYNGLYQYSENGNTLPTNQVTDWYVIARWGKERSINVNAPGRPDYGDVPFIDIVGTYTTRMKYSGIPPDEKIKEIKPASCKGCELVEVLYHIPIK